MRKQIKAQMEAFGLIFIVLLLGLGILFLSYSSIKKQKESQILSPQNTEIAQLTIDAIKKIKLNCITYEGSKLISIEDFIQDIVTEDNSLPYCNSTEGYIPSKVLFEKSIKTILNSTLEAWNIPYYFELNKKIDEENRNVYVYIKSSYELCNNEDKLPGDQGVQIYPIRNGGGIAQMKIYTCEMKYVNKNITT